MNNTFKGFTLSNFKTSLYLNSKLFFKSTPAMVALAIVVVYMGFQFTFGPLLFNFLSTSTQSESLVEVSKFILLGGMLCTSAFLLIVVPIPLIGIRKSGFSKRIGNMNISWGTYALFTLIFIVILSEALLLTYSLFSLLVWTIAMGFELSFFGILLNILVSTTLFISVSIFLGSISLGLSTLFKGNWFSILIGFLYIQVWCLLVLLFYIYKINDQELNAIFYIIDPLLFFIKTSTDIIWSRVVLWQVIIIIPESIIISSLIMTSIIKFSNF